MKKYTFEDLQRASREFVEERGWQQYQSPKNLAMALCGEAGELVTELQWLTQAESLEITGRKREAVVSEMADVMIYLARLADELDVDLLDAAMKKNQANASKYPADKVQGVLKRPHDYDEEL